MSTRKEAKERTRRRLLDAMVELLDEEGPDALTTVRITERAGIAQPTFYVHFADIDSALEASAEEVAGAFLGAISKATAAPLPERGRIRVTYRRLLSGMLEDRRLARIFLRHRRDVRSPFGRHFARILSGARGGFATELERAGAARPELAATLVIGMCVAVSEAVVDGRLEHPDSAIDELVHATRPLLAPAPGAPSGGAGTRRGAPT